MSKTFKIDKLGVWTWLDHADWSQTARFVRSIEEMGYGSLWVPEAVGRDPFVLLGALATQTQSLQLATGIANIYARDAMTMNAARLTLDELSDGRIILGIGVSHQHLVSKIRKHEYGKPVTTMRNYLEAMSGSLFMAPQREKNSPLLLAALRDRMMELARDMADGAHPYFVPPEHTARARGILGNDKLLATEQMLLLESDPAKARAIARTAMDPYIKLPNYQNNLLNLGGFNSDDFENGGSDKLVDAIVAWGDEKALRQRIDDHWQAGADQVCIQALRPDGEAGPHEETLNILAPNNN